MKTIKLVILTSIAFFLIEACADKIKEQVKQSNKNDLNCLPHIEILRNGDTINKRREDGTKEGHWIFFEWIVPMGKEPNGAAGKLVRAKVEEGYYKNNKKEGFWKFYNQNEGKFKDSVEYKNDVAVK